MAVPFVSLEAVLFSWRLFDVLGMLLQVLFPRDRVGVERHVCGSDGLGMLVLALRLQRLCGPAASTKAARQRSRQ
jgi:hypothetical protein